MLGLLSPIKDSIPIGKKIHDPTTEGIVNRLHFRVTVALLLGCSLLVTCLEWVGDGSKISCVMEGPDDDWTIPPNVINTYCFVLTTFLVPNHFSSKVGQNTASLGVGDYVPREDETRHSAYYQWVPFVLFLQALCFYLPHIFFKMWEGGKVKNIIAGLNQLILDKKDRQDKEKVLAVYFVESLNTHNFWALKMLFVEFLNLVNVIGQIYFVDLFLGGEFSTYGLDALKFLEADPENRIDPMALVFPRVTKCSFYKYGPSGTIQTHDAICVLPVNIMNEKVFVVLWFWLIALAIFTIISLLYHIFVMITPAVTKVYLRSRSMHQKDIHLDEIGHECEVGDWKLLYLLARNMEPIVFGEFLRELFESLKSSKSSQRRQAVADENDNSRRRNGGSSRSSTSGETAALVQEKKFYMI